MGSNINKKKLLKHSVPKIIDIFKNDNVDIVIFVPVWPMCHQTVGLVQKICEENNIICSTISIIDEITIKLKTKRYISVPYQLGYPLGPIGDYNQQKNTTKKLLYERTI